MKRCDFVLETASPAETQAWGARLAGLLAAGDVAALVGELGAGKTAFVQGLARGLGIRAAVTSPTFILVNQYRTPTGCTLQHVDCYRLSDAAAEMWDVGLGDLFAGDDIVAIEWADRVAALLPDEYLEIGFSYLDENRRRICFSGHGDRVVGIVEQLARYGDSIALS
jgi:tRNA threonylcarbamoyladenosine biosynthesis protein TsaE